MKSFVAAVLALSCLASSPAFAQASASGPYTYCWVKDPNKHEVWLSPAFPAPTGTDPAGTALASEFKAHVATLGGAAATDKLCVTAESREVAEARRRAEIAAIMRKRSFGIRIYDLHEVSWSPSAATSVGAVPAPAPLAVPAPAPAPTPTPARRRQRRRRRRRRRQRPRQHQHQRPRPPLQRPRPRFHRRRSSLRPRFHRRRSSLRPPSPPRRSPPAAASTSRSPATRSSNCRRARERHCIVPDHASSTRACQ